MAVRFQAWSAARPMFATPGRPLEAARGNQQAGGGDRGGGDRGGGGGFGSEKDHATKGSTVALSQGLNCPTRLPCLPRVLRAAWKVPSWDKNVSSRKGLRNVKERGDICWPLGIRRGGGEGGREDGEGWAAGRLGG